MDYMNYVRSLRSGLLLFVCCIAMPALGDDIYFSVEGATQGKIVGEVIAKGLEGKMRALGFSAGLRTPWQDGTSRIRATREHNPVMVTREPGRGSPQLLHALITTELLKTVRFDFYGLRIVNGAKQMVLYQTIRLSNATLDDFEQKSEPATDLSGGAVRSREVLVFSYQKIELIDQERNVPAQDVVIQ